MVQNLNKESLLTLCKKLNFTKKDITLLEKALLFSSKYLLPKKRLAGDTFFDHTLRVAKILAENGYGVEIVAAGILHGVLKYVSKEEFTQKFGEDLYQLVSGTQEVQNIKSKNPQLQSVALRKVILTTFQDVRVIVIKLANKLDNLRTVHVLSEEEQQRIAKEVLEIYAPLAYRLGVEKIRTQLEDRAFHVLNPKKHAEISAYLEESREEREQHVKDAIALFKRAAQDSVSIKSIKGRPKHIYSIYKKVLKKKLRLQELYDLIGIRIIVPEVKDCYALLGILHEKFEPIEGRLKDYIANPKQNFYRSLHTALKLPGGKVAEVQIRTQEMDEFAQEGVAAHWRYKGLRSEEVFEKKMAWLRGVLDLQKDAVGKDFLETVKVDLFGDKMYCYTPKGDVKELPLHATVLDFAYLVHEEVGNTCVGARVNGKFVPIKSTLVAGDIVQIITNKNQRPRRSWIKVVVSAKSRQKIRKSLKEHENLPAFHFRRLKPVVLEEQGVLVHSHAFPKATCVLAKCCYPIPKDTIIGIVTKRRVISVHKEECRHALKEESRWVPVSWKETFSQKIAYYVIAQERSGLLADLLHTIAMAGFEVTDAKAKLLGSVAECKFVLIPRDLEELTQLIARVGKVRGVKRIYFE